MQTNKKAAFIAMISALPFMFLASLCWHEATKGGIYSDVPGKLGDFIFYALGFPLATFVFNTFLKLGGGRFDAAHEIWTLLFLNLAFLIQWLVWSQPVAFLWRNRERIIEDAANFISKIIARKFLP
jgi:hypothetical protein